MPAKKKIVAKETIPAQEAAPIVNAWKGFDDKNGQLVCRDHVFEVGKTYNINGKIKACESGFHACHGHPFDVWEYYSPSSDNGILRRYAGVAMSGTMDVQGNKTASASITITATLTLPEFIQRGIDWILANISTTEANTGDQSAATNTGDRSAATNTGDRSAATNTGDRSAATNTGDQSSATNTGNQSAATNTGYRSAATNTGDRSAATVTGTDSVAIASGYEGKASAANGCGLCIVERDYSGKLVAIFSAIAGVTDGIKPDTYYMLKNGKPVEARP